MKSKLNRKFRVCIASCIFLFLLFSTQLLSGQVYRFINYGSEANIPNGFIYTLNQDENGFLWVGTGSGIAKFDGFNFHPVLFPDSAAGRYPTANFRDKDGTLWFGCNDGTVFFTRESSLVSCELSNKRAVSSIIQSPDGHIMIISEGGSVFRADPSGQEKTKTLFSESNELFFSACYTQSGDLFLGSQGTLAVCKQEGDSIKISSRIEEFNYANIRAIQRIGSTSSYMIGTDGNGLFRLDFSEKGYSLDHLKAYPEFGILNVQAITTDSEENLWISTYESGVLQIQFEKGTSSIESYRFFNVSSGLPGNSVRTVFQDVEENYWLGLFGNGLSLLNSYAFSFFAPGHNPDENNIIYVNTLRNKYFLGAATGYFLFDATTNKTAPFTDLNSVTGRSEISSYCIDKYDNIWIGTKGGGLYVKKNTGAVSLFYRSGDSGKDHITDIEANEKYIFTGTLNGVVILERNSGRVKASYNIDNGLPHNSINSLYLLPDGSVAVATKTDRVYYINPESGVIQGKVALTGNSMNEILSYYRTSDGYLWAATKGNGIFEIYSDSTRSFTKADMMMSDYCYSITGDSLDRIWIGHQKGFSRYNRETGIMRTYGTDFAGGGDCNPGAMYESPDGKVFIGTTQGLIVYDRQKDKKKLMAPLNNIVSVSINDVEYPLKQFYSLPYSRRYIVKVGYVGINFSDPEKVYYQTKLENYDNEWTKITAAREIPYSLGDGRYKFNLISVNESGLSQEKPVTFELFIKKPFWRTWWFILSVAAFISFVIVLIVRQREKAQKKIQVYLEQELDARTSVVMKQKYELELQNIEITDSINYAKRIQTSILPDFQKLKDVFEDAFIFFRPRDIVSGDFYWFDKLDENKFILVCADSTGHGVPGAFMSMIGSTLLQDIITRQRVVKPSEVLKLLDRQIFSTLNQNIELGVANDGMDMVVCEINIKTRNLRFASAMRPVIMVMGGDSFYIKGNRCSVGGESVIEKYYDDQEYYLNEGDSIYMFSDGLPDQFGGTDGKKMKIARLKKLIDEINHLSMAEQKEKVMEFFDEWKGSYEQVDDILLIGLRL